MTGPPSIDGIGGTEEYARTVAPLIVADCVRSLAKAYESLVASIEKTTKAMDGCLRAYDEAEARDADEVRWFTEPQLQDPELGRLLGQVRRGDL